MECIVIYNKHKFFIWFRINYFEYVINRKEIKYSDSCGTLLLNLYMTKNVLI